MDWCRRLFPTSQGPSKPFASSWEPVSNSKCNNTVNSYGERERWLSKTNVQAYVTNKKSINVVTILIKFYVFWFSVPSHMGIFQRNSFYFLPKDLLSLFPSIPKTSISGCDDAPVPQASRSQLFTDVVSWIDEFPLLLPLTAGVMGTWEHMLSQECFSTTDSAAADHPLYFWCCVAYWFFYLLFHLELIIHQARHWFSAS